ncbi:MAG TPA: ABC transporter substrate-binding protein [Pseudonocardiaceae bacterium]|nr:ABC transporter substrate-binding protein [Pseudonocardiaceae bacterium]
MNRRYLVTGLAAVLALSVAACGNSGPAGQGGGSGSLQNSNRLYSNKAQPTSGAPVTGGTIKVAIEGPVESMDPSFYQHSRIDWSTTNLLYDPLTLNTANGGLQPMLATKWTPSANFTTWTYQLRPGVTFQDGTPFNADAVVFEYNRLLAADTKYQGKPELCGMKSATASGDLTVVFHLAAPCSPFPFYIAAHSDYIPSPTAVRKYGDAFAQHPVGTGPFMLADPSQAANLNDVKLVRNPHYWQKSPSGAQLPYLDGVELTPLSDNTTRFQSLQSGTYDLIETTDTTSVQSALRSADLQVQETYNSESDILYLNMRAAPFNNLDLRKAVSYAVDRNQIASVAFNGFTPPSNSYLLPGTPYYSKDTVYPDIDVAKAKDLVKKAQAAGASANVTFLVDSSESPSLVTLVQQELRAVGFTVTVKTVDLSTSLEVIFGQHAYQIATGPSVTAVDPAQLEEMFGSTAAQNASGYNSSATDGVFAQGLSLGTNDPKRKDVYQTIQSQVEAQVPSVPLVRVPADFIVSGKVHGLADPVQQADQALLLTTVYMK